MGKRLQQVNQMMAHNLDDLQGCLVAMERAVRELRDMVEMNMYAGQKANEWTVGGVAGDVAKIASLITRQQDLQRTERMLLDLEAGQGN